MKAAYLDNRAGGEAVVGDLFGGRADLEHLGVRDALDSGQRFGGRLHDGADREEPRAFELESDRALTGTHATHDIK